MKIGDIVQIMSGSPAMTVTAVNDKICSCIWFYEGELKKAGFNINVLKEVKQKSKK